MPNGRQSEAVEPIKARLVAGTWFAGFAMWSTLLALAPVLTQVGSELRLARSELGFVFSLPVLALAAGAPIGGLMADRMGPRRTGTIGITLVGLGGLLRGFSFDLGSLLLFGVIFGAGWGLSLPALPKVVSGWFSRSTVGTATGIYTTGAYVGAGLATAFVLDGSWRTSVVIWGLLALSISAVWYVMVRDPPRVQEPTPVRLGAVARNRKLIALTVIFFFGANVTFYTLTGWLPEILSATSQSPSTYVASLLSFSAGLTSFFVPLLSDRVRLRRPFLLVPCLGGSIASYALFDGSTLMQEVAVVALGVAIGAVFVICLTLSAELVDRSLVGSAAGFMLLAYVGGVFGPYLSGLTQDISGGFVPTMIMLVLSFLISAVLVPILPETGKQSVAQSYCR